MKKLNIYISLGEPSGLNLFKNCLPHLLDIQQEYVNVNWRGMGLENSGLKPAQNLAKVEELAVQGYLSVIKKISFFRALLKKWELLLAEAKKLQDEGEECKILLIDYPGLNMKILKRAQKLGLRVSWLAPPQIWAWKSGRGKSLKNVNVGVLFEHELESLTKYKANAQLLGYPLFDATGKAKIPYWNLMEQENSQKVLLVPGSREAVWKEQLPLWLELCEKRGVEAKVWMSEPKQLDLIKKEFPNLEIAISLKQAIKGSKCALCRPGTASLELALTGIPMAGFSVLSFWKHKFYKVLIKDKRLLLANLLISKKAWLEVIFSDIENANFWFKEWYHSELNNKAHFENLNSLRKISFKVNVDINKRWKAWLKEI
jgi:lipid-A-disaccharide synthase